MDEFETTPSEDNAELESWYHIGYREQEDRLAKAVRGQIPFPQRERIAARHGVEGKDLTEYFFGVHEAIIDHYLAQISSIVRGLDSPLDQHKLARRLVKFAERQVES